MNKEKLLQKIDSIKKSISKHLLRTSIFAVTAVAPAHTTGNNPSSSADDFAPNASLTSENIYIVPEAVNIAPQNNPSPIYEFTNKVYDKNNREVKDFVDVTKYSLWDCSYKREVGNLKNPVGVISDKGFYGSLQFNRFNAENMAIYGLLNPTYEKLASKFFVKKAGFDKAIENFKKSAQNYKKLHGDANLVYHVGSVARKALSQYISPNFKTIFQKEGLENTQQFLNLQRAYAGEIYCTFNARGLNKIIATLEASKIKPEQVNPAIWGMFLAKNIKGGFGGIANLLKGKNLKQINSLTFVNETANKYPDVFKEGSGVYAWKFAKEHYKETHSITTMKELSIILQKPEILDHYLKCLSFNQNGTINFSQAQELLINGLPPKLIQQNIKFADLLPQVQDKTRVVKLTNKQNIQQIIKNKKYKVR